MHPECAALIQTCLHGCLGAVLHARNILPDRAFEHTDVELGNPKEKVKMIVLRKGSSMRAGHLLNWLNDGVFGALRRGELSGFQICIHVDSKRRGQTLETYTFTIQYVSDTDGKLRPTSVNLEGMGTDELDVLVSNAAKDLHNTLQLITSLCRRIPVLPNERYLSMNLFLLPHAKNAESIEGFIQARRESTVWPEHNEWERQTEAFSTLSASMISTRLKMSYMAPSHEHPGQQPDMEELQEFVKAVRVTDDIDWNLTNITTKGRAPQRNGRVTRNAGRPSLVSGSSRQALQVGNGVQPHPNSSVSHSDRRQSQKNDDTQGAETQLAAARIAMALDNMARSVEYSHGDTQAASLPLVPLQVTQQDIMLQYNYDAMHHERAPASALRSQAHELSKEIGGTTRSGQVILCQCGYSKEEGDMLRCAICHTWQHAHCYGYIGKEDPRRPEDQHLCYICYVNPREPEGLVQLINLAVHRRAMYHTMRHGIMGKGDFADKLGMDGSIAFPIFEKFKHEGYIIAASGSHKAGFKTTGKPPWVPAGDPASGRALDEYFKPTTTVEDYFKPNSVLPSLIKDKLVIAAATALPAAATPMADKQKRKRAPVTPSSNLDSPLQGVGGSQTRSSTRRGRVYKPAEGFEDDSTSDDALPSAKHARSSITKNANAEAPAKDKLINLESLQMIDVGSTSGR